jgi:aromatic ring-opening dioxygenase LigB subunit
MRNTHQDTTIIHHPSTMLHLNLHAVLQVIALLSCLQHQQVAGELVASVILPHGDFALDPTLLPEDSHARRAAEEVATAARTAGAWLSTTIDPGILLISTPHGIELTTDFALYLGSSASGYADIGQDLHNNEAYRLLLDTIPLAPNATHDLISHLQGQGVSGILNYADSEDMALRWGEVIPLLLVGGEEQHRSSQHKRDVQRQRRHMILSHPLRRYTDSPIMLPELVQLGKSIRQWADARPERIALLISSDLSHTHRTDGPYGYSNVSAPFDAAVGRWAANPVRNADSLLVDATLLQDRAMSCGFTGLVMLHGSLIGNDDDDCTSGCWESQVWANRNATYYGMMVATFTKKVEQKRGGDFQVGGSSTK